MTGIVSGGISFGTLLLPPVVTQLISIYNWRVTYIIIGAAALIFVIIGAQFLKHSQQPDGAAPNRAEKIKPPDPSSAFSLKEAMHTRQFWMVAAVYLFFGLVQLTVMVHIVPDATGMNISPISAAAILSIIGGVSLAGRIIMGMISAIEYG
jgi:predicted MFS family arabinose efflux permease